MFKTINAIFDGEVLRPDKPIEIKPNTHVRLTIETLESPDIKTRSFLQTALSLKIEGPPDWSENFEDYLYNNSVESNG